MYANNKGKISLEMKVYAVSGSRVPGADNNLVKSQSLNFIFGFNFRGYANCRGYIKKAVCPNFQRHTASSTGERTT